MDMMSYLMGRNSGGAKKGAKIEVVTELPETGEANVIYLVPKETEDENNIFDEYLYINDEWELIGSTDIDLSNYYTKSEINKFSPMYDFLSTTTATTIPSGGLYLPANDLTVLTAIVNEVYSKGQHSFGIHFSYYENMGESILFSSALSNRLIQMKPTTYDFVATFPQNASFTQLVSLRSYLFRIEMVWNGDVATVTSARIFGGAGFFLSTKNESSYTPTGDYNPATKKYVDDAIAGVGGQTIQYETMPTASADYLGKIVQYTGTTDSNYTNGYFYVCVSETENDVTTYSWSNVNVQEKSKSYPVYVAKLSVRVGETVESGNTLTDSDMNIILNIINNAFQKGYEYIILQLEGNSNSNKSSVLLTYCNENIQNKPTSITFGGMGKGNSRLLDNSLPFIYSYQLVINIQWSNDVASKRGNSTYYAVSKAVLLTSNTAAYTPTSNYHPATKKYVDDSIAAAITTTLGGSY